MNLASEEFSALIHQSAALRGAGDFPGSIALVESRFSEMEPDCYLDAFQECFYAAREAAMVAKATDYARKLLAVEPDLPSATEFLGILSNHSPDPDRPPVIRNARVMLIEYLPDLREWDLIVDWSQAEYDGEIVLLSEGRPAYEQLLAIAPDGWNEAAPEERFDWLRGRRLRLAIENPDMLEKEFPIVSMISVLPDDDQDMLNQIAAAMPDE